MCYDKSLNNQCGSKRYNSPMKTICFLILAALAGCSTWNHQTKGKAEFERDAYECERDAAPVAEGMRAYNMRRQCMRLKGWVEN